MDANQKDLVGQPLPVACDLSGGLLDGSEEVEELEDGYELRFPGNDGSIERLARFVSLERRCCRFLTFGILLEPNLCPVALTMRGPEGAKKFLESAFMPALAGKFSPASTVRNLRPEIGPPAGNGGPL